MKRLPYFALNLLCALLMFGQLAAQGSISQLADLNTGPNSGAAGSMSYDGSAVFFDGRTFYAAQTGVTGLELWVTDGTPLNTRLFADICPGICASVPAQFYVEGGNLYFAADDGVHGRELWRLAAGATAPALVSDINPGAEGSDPKLFERVSFRVASTRHRVFQPSWVYNAQHASSGGYRRNAKLSSRRLHTELCLHYRSAHQRDGVERFYKHEHAHRERRFSHTG